MPWLLLVGAILSEVTASLSLKAALTHPALYVLVVAGYLSSFSLLALVLRRGMPLGVAYGVWGASGVVLTSVLSTLLFAEPLTGLMGLGILLVAAGVMVVEIGSQRAHATGTTAPGPAAALATATSEIPVVDPHQEDPR
ncbi:SMR family transporter [Brachybacterium rhamnosum]|uniref:Multidrug efflux SMR transporter n=1 Tax=Brachybacterium rhamnosum TaxID=173361 RepID=A0ABW4PWF8_9MICO